MRILHVFSALAMLAIGLAEPAAALTTPEAFLGFKVGADRKLAGYGQIVQYFEKLDQESPRLELRKLGKTTLGRDLVMAVISSEKNLAQLDAERAQVRKMTDPRQLTPEEIKSLPASGKVFVLVTCNIHASEIGASQMAMEWAYDLCATRDPKQLQQLDNVVLLLMPSINPDGEDMIVDYYKKYLGTQWEGGRLPWLYHHYAGHDDNRDWFMLNLNETKIVNQVLHHDWFPQVFLDMHQMGLNGPRIFTPPNADPITPLVHPMQWRLNDLFGTQMGFRLEEAGKSGAISGWSYDAYWPGGTKNTACLKNVIGLLTEVASCRIASPVYVDPNELTGGRKGLPDYRQQSNFPNPWPGGWWRLRDIVDYELIAGNALLEACSNYRQEILASYVSMGKSAVDKGLHEAPYAYVIPDPKHQHDPHAAQQLFNILTENGLEAKRSEAELFTEDGRSYPAGTTVFFAAQPYRAFLVEMMERQRYPEVREGPETKEIFKPYDVTAWTLPLMMGVNWERVDRPFIGRSPDQPFEARFEEAKTYEVVGTFQTATGRDFIVHAKDNAAYRLVNQLLAKGVRVSRALETTRNLATNIEPGDFLIAESASARLKELSAAEGVPIWTIEPDVHPRAAVLRAPRIGLYKPWTASIDEGWTRLVLDRYGYKYTSLDNEAMKKNLAGRYDVIILPDVDKNVIIDGKAKNDEGGYFEPLPPPYSGGIGKEGVAALKSFVQGGGTLVCLTSSCDLATEELGLPVRNVVAKAKPSEFSLPGTLVNLKVATDHPISWGMPAECAAYVTGGPVFTTTIPGANVSRTVAATYPEYADQVVASGWAEGTEQMTGRAAIVEAGLGKGHVELIGPRVQCRAQMVGTYKFLFNAILRGGLQAEGEVAAARTRKP